MIVGRKTRQSNKNRHLYNLSTHFFLERKCDSVICMPKYVFKATTVVPLIPAKMDGRYESLPVWWLAGVWLAGVRLAGMGSDEFGILGPAGRYELYHCNMLIRRLQSDD